MVDIVWVVVIAGLMGILGLVVVHLFRDVKDVTKKLKKE